VCVGDVTPSLQQQKLRERKDKRVERERVIEKRHNAIVVTTRNEREER